MDRMELYRDIAQRTGGDIYMGVVGPVRTGKSTFIKRFMDLLILPGIVDEYEKARLIDELPQSAAGKTVMTTQPRFVPNEAARLMLDEKSEVRVRMVDCVGYMVSGAAGHMENDAPRMVRTPWFDYDVPFEDAAEIGTRKVITEHSTVGIVVTTDGSITGIPREDYMAAEERVVRELRAQGKPFVVILNSTHPYSDETQAMAVTLTEAYGTPVRPMDVLNMGVQEAVGLLEGLLLEFPVRMVQVDIPSWMRMLGEDHWLVKSAMEPLVAATDALHRMGDGETVISALAGLANFEAVELKKLELGSGVVEVELRPAPGLFYTVLGEACGCEIQDDAHLVSIIKECVVAKREYDRLSDALACAYRTGYGMVPPSMDELSLDAPELMQQGSRYGVRLRARATGLHLVKVDLETEIAPLVGNETQAEEFCNYLNEAFRGEDKSALWSTSIFGKPLSDLVRDGMSAKVGSMPDAVQQKLQRTIERMVNEGCTNLICLLF